MDRSVILQEGEVRAAAIGLAQALAAMIFVIREAVQAYHDAPIDGLESSARKWETAALPNLSTDWQALQPCLSNPLAPSNAETLLRISSNELGLSKNLDAFRWDFAGPEHQRTLEQNVDRTVDAASALLKALRRPD